MVPHLDNAPRHLCYRLLPGLFMRIFGSVVRFCVGHYPGAALPAAYVQLILLYTMQFVAQPGRRATPDRWFHQQLTNSALPLDSTGYTLRVLILLAHMPRTTVLDLRRCLQLVRTVPPAAQPFCLLAVVYPVGCTADSGPP